MPVSSRKRNSLNLSFSELRVGALPFVLSSSMALKDKSLLLPKVDIEAVVPLRGLTLGFGGRGGDFRSLGPVVARLNQPKGVVIFRVVEVSLGGGCGEGDRAALVVLFWLDPQGTEGSDAEKFGNREGRGKGFVIASLVNFSVWSIESALDLTDCVALDVTVDDLVLAGA